VRFERLLSNGELQTFEGFVFDHSVILEDSSGGRTTISDRGLAGTFAGVPLENPSRPLYGWFAVYVSDRVRS
jgi:hypothetical protein